MKTSTILTITKFIFWVVFIGLLIKTGALLFNFGMSINTPESAKNIYLGLDLFELREASLREFIAIGSLLITVIALQSYIAYLIIKIITKGSFKNPFTDEIAALLNKISYIALCTGIISYISSQYCDRLIKRGMEIPLDWGAQEFVFLAAVIFIVAKVFQKGIELQKENELTV